MRWMIHRAAWPLLHFLTFASVAFAGANTVPSTQQSEPGSELRISLITMGPGDEAYEKFGHIALRIRNSQEDAAFNWGIFDFDQKNFVFNFIQGRMWYSTEADMSEPMLKAYAAHNRDIWEQELNLTPAQKKYIVRRCFRDIDPKYRDYLYDYYRNNCSTRVRDVLDDAVGGEIKKQSVPVVTDTTFRWHTRRDTADSLPLYVALETMLGPSVDHPLNAWDEMFLPTVLRERLRSITVPDADGNRVPLVKSEQVLSKSTATHERTIPRNFIPMFLAIGSAIALWLAIFGRMSVRTMMARLAFLLVAIPWMLLIGVGGLIICWAACATDHAAGYYNVNLLNVSPLYLLLLPLIVRAVFRPQKPSRRAFHVATVVLGLAVLGLLLKAVGLFRQVNGDIIALTLPAHVALWWIAWTAWKRVAPAAVESPVAPAV